MVRAIFAWAWWLWSARNLNLNLNPDRLLFSPFSAKPSEPRSLVRGEYPSPCLPSNSASWQRFIPAGSTRFGRSICRSQSGELLVLLGPSGSGKSTILRLIAGLERPTAGSILVDGRDLNGVPPHRRDVAMVFQNPALYPHLSVFGNLVFRSAQPRSFAGAGAIAGEPRLGRSGSRSRAGPQARVRFPAASASGWRSAGRCVREPRIVLFDEPFSNLDVPLRAGLREEVIELHRRLKTTLIHVTHDQSEALIMGDGSLFSRRASFASATHPGRSTTVRRTDSSPLSSAPLR